MLFKRDATQALPAITTEADLRKAIAAIHAATDVAKSKTHIRAAAKALKLEAALPACWTDNARGAAILKFLGGLDAKAGEIAKGYGDGQAVDFDQAQTAMEDSEAASGLMQEVNEAVCALGSAVWSIQSDDTVASKGEAVQASLSQFADHVKTIVPEGVENALVAEALSQAGYTINSLGGIELSKGADSMTMKEIAKRLGLPETATETEILTKMAANEAAAIAPLEADEIAYIGKLTADSAAAFIVMKAADRKKKMKDMPKGDVADPAEADDVEKSIKKGDAFRTEGGVILTKKDFGSDAGFQFAKQQATDNAALKADVQKGKDDADKTARIAKADKALVHIGKADDIGSLLHQIAKKDPALADKVEALLKSANDVIEKGEVMREHGGSHQVAGSASEAIHKAAQELMKTDTKAFPSIEKARTEIRKRNPDLLARENEESKTARAA